MSTNLNIVVTSPPFPHAHLRTEICEHKGAGHPDSICDGVAEAVSQALCAAYLNAYGEVRHHNVDKALLIGGQSMPKFGGGRIEAPMRLIIAGRADPLPGMADVAGIVRTAARHYIAASLRCPPDLFEIESAVRAGSPSLRRVVDASAAAPLANDTSFGVGFAPYSQLEQTVLHVAALLKSPPFRTAFPAAGDDIKVMGVRVDSYLGLIIALALVDREVESAAHYFSLKKDMAKWLAEQLDAPCDIRINTLDDASAANESGLYLTVCGLSAENGDDGEVGRGNRVSGLITPSRPMSLEAAAGKNPVSHVGKIYNVLASRLANDLVSHIPSIDEAAVQILSCIGNPINRPQLVDIQVALEDAQLDEHTARRVREAAIGHFDRIGALTRQLARGELRVF